MIRLCALILLAAMLAAAQQYDVLIQNGTIVDGSGAPGYRADIAIQHDRIAAIGKLAPAAAKKVVDASGLVIAPGFIDMLGQSELSLLIDSRSLSKLSQGITTEITGEGGSIAPQNERTLAPMKPQLDEYKLQVDWTGLDGYFRRLEREGTPINFGTYVGAAQIREAVVGDDNRDPTAAEMDQMKEMTAQAMKDGALGISTALIYPPGHYAKTSELIELAKIASRYGGLYATHMRSEGASEQAAVDEAIRIGFEAHIPVEIFHLKVSGKSRWGSMPRVVAQLQRARNAGLDIGANIYPYVAGATALASSLPPWVADGGMDKLLERLRDPQTRARIKKDMATSHKDWENLYLDCGGAPGVMISSVIEPALKKYTGKRVSEVAVEQKKDALDTLFDFVLADHGQTGALYFGSSEQDNEYAWKQPWTSVGLDSGETSLDGPLFEPHTHPRTFGSMPRVLGPFVRDKHLTTLPEAVRKVTGLPAQRERLLDRGLLKPGFFADITIFNAATITDEATFQEPAKLSKGIEFVYVNGQLAFEKGNLTAVKSGRVLRGPGWRQ